LSKYLTRTFMLHCSAMICQSVTLSGDAEWPKVADAVIEALLCSAITLSSSLWTLTRAARIIVRDHNLAAERPLVQPGEKKNPFCVRPAWHIMTPYAQTTLPEE
jgi:hypothetical protein